jgi:hypothetical protein
MPKLTGKPGTHSVDGSPKATKRMRRQESELHPRLNNKARSDFDFVGRELLANGNCSSLFNKNWRTNFRLLLTSAFNFPGGCLMGVSQGAGRR